MTYRSVFVPGLFAGRTVVVTGGGSGIGRCTAHELAALGAHVVLVGRNTDKLTATAAEIAEDGGQASWHSCDIRNEEAVKAMVAGIVAARGRIDALVNNAGGQYITPLEKMSAGFSISSHAAPPVIFSNVPLMSPSTLWNASMKTFSFSFTI